MCALKMWIWYKLTKKVLSQIIKCNECYVGNLLIGVMHDGEKKF